MVKKKVIVYNFNIMWIKVFSLLTFPHELWQEITIVKQGLSIYN